MEGEQLSDRCCYCLTRGLSVPGVVSTGDENEAEGPVEKANGEVSR